MSWTPNRRLLLFKFLLLAAAIQLLWGFTPSASRIILDYLPVEGYSAIRYTVSGFIFLVYTLVSQRRLRVRLPDLPVLIVLGVLTYAINSLGTLYGLQLGGVLNFALASSFNSIITAGVAAFVLKEKLSRTFAVAALLSLAGGFVLFLGKFEVSSLNVAGGSLLLIWTAYIFEALGFSFSKRYKERLPLSEYMAVLQLSGAACMWGVSAVTGRLPAAVFTMPATAWGALIFVCLIACALCYFVMYWLLNHIEGHRLAFFDCFHTLAAAVFGAWLFSEPFNAKMLVGGALMLGAVFTVTRQAMSKE